MPQCEYGLNKYVPNTYIRTQYIIQEILQKSRYQINFGECKRKLGRDFLRICTLCELVTFSYSEMDTLGTESTQVKETWLELLEKTKNALKYSAFFT